MCRVNYLLFLAASYGHVWNFFLFGYSENEPMSSFSMNYCHVCGAQLAPDDFDAICSDCDIDEDEEDVSP